ncbi:MAG: response regulator, partial [Clostridiaceae bacterium]|nr:response regulator [Clostridiaceae bacterium]
MYKLIIADDEPLVCVGVQSMLDWEAMGIEIVGIARNGQKAAELIEENKPDIVITDIKMPIKNGLQLAQESKDKYGEVPAFIILTSYEDFEYARQAIQAQTLDYLVKLELDEKTLSKAIRNAIEAVDKQRRMHPGQQVLVRSNMQALREKFFIRLFNNLFDGEENYQVQRRDLDIDQKAEAYAVATCSVMQNDECSGSDKPFSLYSSVMQLVRETICRYLPCYVVPLDMWHFSIVFCLDETVINNDYKALIREALIQTSDLLYRYMSVSLRSIVGKTVDDLRRLDISYRQSQHCCRQVGDSTVAFYDDYSVSTSDYIISLQTLRQSISKAFEEMDMAALNKSFSRLADIFVSHPDDLLNAMDTACNILYMAISLLPDGEAMVEQIFADSSESYRSLYRLRDVDSIS